MWNANVEKEARPNRKANSRRMIGTANRFEQNTSRRKCDEYEAGTDRGTMCAWPCMQVRSHTDLSRRAVQIMLETRVCQAPTWTVRRHSGSADCSPEGRKHENPGQVQCFRHGESARVEGDRAHCSEHVVPRIPQDFDQDDLRATAIRLQYEDLRRRVQTEQFVSRVVRP